MPSCVAYFDKSLHANVSLLTTKRSKSYSTVSVQSSFVQLASKNHTQNTKLWYFEKRSCRNFRRTSGADPEKSENSNFKKHCRWGRKNFRRERNLDSVGATDSWLQFFTKKGGPRPPRSLPQPPSEIPVIVWWEIFRRMYELLHPSNLITYNPFPGISCSFRRWIHKDTFVVHGMGNGKSRSR